MFPRIQFASACLALFVAVASTPAWATTPVEVQATLAAAARSAEPGFSGFSAQRGESFYRTHHSGDWSCSSCHTDNPAANGSHAITKKTIRPFAPAANTERFTNPEKIEKWFKRNCNDVLKRACTAQEKGDLIAYLLTIKP